MPSQYALISAYGTCYPKTSTQSFGKITYAASTGQNYDLVVYILGQNTGFTAQANGNTQLNGFFDELPNDFYEVWCVGSFGSAVYTSKTVFISDIEACQIVPPTPVCNISAVSISSTNETAFGALDGTATIKVSTSAGGLQIRLYKKLFDTGYQPATSNVNKVFTGLAGGTYFVEAKDANNCVLPTHQVVVLAAVKSGCMDPNATNYDPTATVDNGTCVYAPPLGEAIFHFPILNAFRFVVSQAIDNCSTFINPDNVLFCNENVRGVVHGVYNQKVLACDTVRTQFHSNLSTHTAQLIELKTGISTLLTITNPLSFTDRQASFTAGAVRHADGRTRIYYNELDFTFNLQVNTLVTLSNNSLFNGTYAVKLVGQDSAGTLPYFVIQKPWPFTLNRQENVTVDSTYNELEYDVFEFDVNFIGKPVGVYKILVTGSNGGDGVVAESEPIEILPNSTKDLHLIQWYNQQDSFGLHFSTGIEPKIRVESLLRFPKPGGERSVYHDGENKLFKIHATKTRIREFKTLAIPPYLHEKLAIVLDCDIIKINGRRYQTSDPYEAEYSNRAALANGRIDVEQVGWFDTENSHDLGA
jgi:hypothetical protein